MGSNPIPSAKIENRNWKPKWGRREAPTQNNSFFGGGGERRIMTKYFLISRLTVILSVVSWLVPFLVSMFLINPETKETIISPVLFKSLMLVILALITVFGYRKILNISPLTIQTPNTFLAINIVFDLVVLVTLLSVPFQVWLLTVLPIYLLVFYGAFLLMRKYAI